MKSAKWKMQNERYLFLKPVGAALHGTNEKCKVENAKDIAGRSGFSRE